MAVLALALTFAALLSGPVGADELEEPEPASLEDLADLSTRALRAALPELDRTDADRLAIALDEGDFEVLGDYFTTEEMEERSQSGCWNTYGIYCPERPCKKYKGNAQKQWKCIWTHLTGGCYPGGLPNVSDCNV